jgi:hypothetical protein
MQVDAIVLEGIASSTPPSLGRIEQPPSGMLEQKLLRIADAQIDLCERFEQANVCFLQKIVGVFSGVPGVKGRHFGKTRPQIFNYRRHGGGIAGAGEGYISLE